MAMIPESRAERSRREASYFGAIADRGVDAFLRNGSGLSLRVHLIDGTLVPIVVSDGRNHKPSFVSPHAHYVGYPIHELGRGPGWWTPTVLRATLAPLSALFRVAKLDQVVYVNHWLLSAGPAVRVGQAPLRSFIAQLAGAYPEHVLVFPGVVPALAPALARTLADLGGRAVRSGVVHLLDPSDPMRGGAMKGVRRNRRLDRMLRHQNQTRRTTDPAVLLQHVDRLQQLYSALYLHKHPGHLNPQYTTDFFELLLRSGLFVVAGWLRDGKVEAFNVQLVVDRVICWSVCGLDVSAPQTRGLFRLLADDDVALAERDGLIVNWGRGNEAFKRLRGARPALEYDLVFDRHVGPARRLPWALLQRLRAWPGVLRSTLHTGSTDSPWSLPTTTATNLGADRPT